MRDCKENKVVAKQKFHVTIVLRKNNKKYRETQIPAGRRGGCEKSEQRWTQRYGQKM